MNTENNQIIDNILEAQNRLKKLELDRNSISFELFRLRLEQYRLTAAKLPRRQNRGEVATLEHDRERVQNSINGIKSKILALALCLSHD